MKVSRGDVVFAISGLTLLALSLNGLLPMADDG